MSAPSGHHAAGRWTADCSVGFALVIAVVCGGCTRETDSATSTSTGVSVPRGQQPFSLPDVSNAVVSVQTQLRTAHAGLLRTIANQSSTVVDRAAAFGELGKLLMAAQYPDGARACFANAQALDPSDFRWPYYLAHIHRTQGDLTKAVGLFDRVLQLRPDDVATLVWLGDVNLSLARPEVAQPLFEKALIIEPTSVSARYGAGRAALASNDPRRAATALEEVLARDPKAAGAHYPLSLAYAALGESKKADEHRRLRQEREILPADPLMVELDELLESPQTYETRGIRALDREAWSEAAALFRRGLVLAPESPALHQRLGTALSMMNDPGGARQEFEAALRASPDHFPALYSLGVMLQADGHHADAIERFAAALAARPTYTEARLRLASSLRRVGRAPEALAHYETLVDSNPELAEARLGRAMTLVQLGRYMEAVNHLTRDTTDVPDNVVLAHSLARLLATAPQDEVRDGRRAMTLVQSLVQKGRTLELGETMAMTLAELGEFERAVGVQRDLIIGAQRAGLAEVVARLSTNLRLYEARRPCRTPWAAGEMR